MPIRTKLVLAFLLLSLVPLVGIGLLAWRNGERAIVSNLGGSFQRMAEQTADRIDRALAQAQHDLTTWAALDVMGEIVTGDADGKIATFLISLNRKYQEFGALIVLDKNGDVVAASQPAYMGAELKSASAFREAMAGKAVVEDVRFDEAERSWVVTFAVPIVAQWEETIGVLVGKWNGAELLALTQPAGQARGAAAVRVVKRDGLVIAAPESQKATLFVWNVLSAGSEAARQAFSGQAGYTVEAPRTGERELVGYAPTRGHGGVTSPGWIVLVAQNAAVAFASIDQLKTLLFVAVLGVALLVALLSVVLTRQITGPVLELAQVAGRVARGDFKARVVYRSRDEIGSLATVFDGMVHDLAVQRAQLVEKDFVDSIITNMLDTLIVLDPEGKVRTANRAALDLLGFQEPDLLGRSGAKLFGDAEHDFLRKRLPGLAAGGLRAFDVAYLTRDGRRIPVSLSASVMKDAGGKVAGIILNAKDITEIKQAEVALREAKDAAEQANQTKSQFLANMSHELRTPLNAVIGYSEMILDDLEESGETAYAADLKKIQAAGKHLLTLINDVLDLSKIEAGKMELFIEEFDLAQLVDEVVSTVQPLVSKNRNQLVVTGHAEAGRMQADVTRVRQVLFNLLSNACKFTEKGTITLAISRERSKRSDRIVMRVKDSGIGMTAEQLGRLFQAFTQADASTTRRFGGTGLGLVICRRFAQMMGGDIVAESDYGHGTTFTVTLPAEVSDPKAKAAMERATLVTGIYKALERKRTASGAHEAPESAGESVLVIDDDANIRDMVVRLVTKEGYKVMAAASGPEGLEMARTFRPSVITLDVMMPEMDGWSVLAELKADAELADIPVIMLTVLDEKNLGYALGASDYVTKPVDRELLVPILRKHLHAAGTGACVLVVDDDEGARQMLRRHVEREGYEVMEAEDGEAALRKLAERRPSLVLLDLFMPKMDGFELVQRLRKDPDLKSLPVVVVTSKELGAEDRLRLSGSVETILERGAMSRDDLEKELASLIRSGVKGPA